MSRKSVIGVVTSDKMDKTITVRVDRLVQVPKYGKYIRRKTMCHAHDEQNAASVGDQVRIVESRPISKLKRWCLVEVVKSSEE